VLAARLVDHVIVHEVEDVTPFVIGENVRGESISTEDNRLLDIILRRIFYSRLYGTFLAIIFGRKGRRKE